MKAQIVVIYLFILILNFGCSNGQKQSNKVEIENFNEFYEKFYTDSIFQISRIVFPLKGQHNLNMHAPEDSIVYEWKKEEWKIKTKMFKGNDSIINIGDNTYKREFKNSDILVTEKIYIENSGYEILKRYSLIDNKWFLTYYSIENN